MDERVNHDGLKVRSSSKCGSRVSNKNLARKSGGEEPEKARHKNLGLESL